MGSVGDCYDNAMAESFFATLETELIDRSDWANPAEAKAAVFEYIEVFYNRIRRHSSLGNLSPEQFEERYRSSPAVAAGDASPSTKPGQLHVGCNRPISDPWHPLDSAPPAGHLRRTHALWRRDVYGVARCIL